MITRRVGRHQVERAGSILGPAGQDSPVIAASARHQFPASVQISSGLVSVPFMSKALREMILATCRRCARHALMVVG